MIKDKEKAAQLLAGFPAMTPELVDEIERECVRQYLFYHKLSHTDVDCFCTHCRERFVNSTKNRMYANFEFKHNDVAKCPHCGANVQLKAMHYGRKTLTDTQLVYAFQGSGNNIYARYMKVRQYFIDEGHCERGQSTEPLCRRICRQTRQRRTYDYFYPQKR